MKQKGRLLNFLANSFVFKISRLCCVGSCWLCRRAVDCVDLNETVSVPSQCPTMSISSKVLTCVVVSTSSKLANSIVSNNISIDCWWSSTWWCVVFRKEASSVYWHLTRWIIYQNKLAVPEIDERPDCFLAFLIICLGLVSTFSRCCRNKRSIIMRTWSRYPVYFLPGPSLVWFIKAAI